MQREAGGKSFLHFFARFLYFEIKWLYEDKSTARAHKIWDQWLVNEIAPLKIGKMLAKAFVQDNVFPFFHSFPQMKSF